MCWRTRKREPGKFWPEVNAATLNMIVFTLHRLRLKCHLLEIDIRARMRLRARDIAVAIDPVIVRAVVYLVGLARRRYDIHR
jgi:hypothetical protein